MSGGLVADSSVGVAWAVHSQASEATDHLLENVAAGTPLVGGPPVKEGDPLACFGCGVRRGRGGGQRRRVAQATRGNEQGKVDWFHGFSCS